MIPIVITLIILLLLSFMTTVWLFVVQKGNRKFERKGVIMYLIICLLLFFVIGLIGLLYLNGLSFVLTIAQVVMFLFGVFHAWFLFANYDWADNHSFLEETLLTAATATSVGLGFLGGLWVWDLVFDPYFGYSILIYKVFMAPSAIFVIAILRFYAPNSFSKIYCMAFSRNLNPCYKP